MESGPEVLNGDRVSWSWIKVPALDLKSSCAFSKRDGSEARDGINNNYKDRRLTNERW